MSGFNTPAALEFINNFGDKIDNIKRKLEKDTTTTIKGGMLFTNIQLKDGRIVEPFIRKHLNKYDTEPGYMINGPQITSLYISYTSQATVYFQLKSHMTSYPIAHYMTHLINL